MFGNKYKDEVEELNTQLLAVNADKLALETRLDEATNTIETFAIKELNYKKTIKAHTTELENLKQSHADQIKKLETSINKRVNATLASIGVSTFAAETFTVDQKKTDDEVYAKFMTLSGSEKTEYYNTNKDIIARVLVKNKNV